VFRRFPAAWPRIERSVLGVFGSTVDIPKSMAGRSVSY
jgi:hypothetical protein